ncbi:TonB family protein [bacterium]|nr:TonB family protein [bacterium]
MQRSSTAIAANFQKPLFKDFDLRFFVILVCALLLETAVVLIMSQQPVEEYSQKEIERIQQRFANFILGETAGRNEESESVSGSTGGSEASVEDDSGANVEDSNAGEEITNEREGTGASRQAARTAAATAQREAVTRNVSNKGLLRMLTGTGSAARGGAVSDLLAAGSGTRTTANLDEVLSSAGGLKTGGTSGLGNANGNGNSGSARGGRSGSVATIDDLVSDLGGARSQSLERKGQLAVESPADVVGRGQRAINRSAQEIHRVIQGHVRAIQYCYERELKRNPELKGKVTVRITVNPDGHVSEVAIVNSTLNNERVERCILSRIRQWKDFKPIDPSDGDVSFRQSFTFGY